MTTSTRTQTASTESQACQISEFVRRMDYIYGSLDDPDLRRLKAVLSIHEIRTLIFHVAKAFGHCVKCGTNWTASDVVRCPVCVVQKAEVPLQVDSAA